MKIFTANDMFVGWEERLRSLHQGENDVLAYVQAKRDLPRVVFRVRLNGCQLKTVKSALPSPIGVLGIRVGFREGVFRPLIEVHELITSTVPADLFLDTAIIDELRQSPRRKFRIADTNDHAT